MYVPGAATNAFVTAIIGALVQELVGVTTGGATQDLGFYEAIFD